MPIRKTRRTASGKLKHNGFSKVKKKGGHRTHAQKKADAKRRNK